MGITEIDSLALSVDGAFNSLIKIDDTHYIVGLADKVSSYDAYLVTLSMDSNYESLTEIEAFEHDTSYSIGTSLVKIDGTHFYLTFWGPGNTGAAKTFSIDGSYENITEIDELGFSDGQWSTSSIMINATHFMTANYSSSGWLRIHSIDGSYGSITSIKTLNYDTTSGAGKTPSLVMIDSTHFILASTGGSDEGFIRTFSIDGSYNISEEDELEHESTYNLRNSLVMIDSTHFMLAYRGSSNAGIIKTFSIDGSYVITQIDSVQFNTYADDLSLVKLDSTHFAVAYSSVGPDATITSFSIDASYNITQHDTLEHDTSTGEESSLCTIDATHVALIYRGYTTNYKAKFKTFEITFPQDANDSALFYSGGL